MRLPGSFPSSFFSSSSLLFWREYLGKHVEDRHRQTPTLTAPAFLEEPRRNLQRLPSKSKISQEERRTDVKEDLTNRHCCQEKSRNLSRECVHRFSNCEDLVELGRMSGVVVGRVWVEE